MQRIDDPSNVPTFPSVLPTVSPGYFRRPSVLAGDQGTIVTADFLNDVQEAIVNPILTAGLSLTKGATSQLTTAIQFLASGLIATHYAVAANESAPGHARFATSAEVLAQALGTVVISPLRLKQAFPASFANPGYIKIPTTAGVAVLQFGAETISTQTLTHDVALPSAFTTAHLATFASSALGSINENDNDAGAQPHPTTPLTHVRLSTGQDARTVYWLSIGQ